MSYHEDISWFEQFKKTLRFAVLKERPVAYFCAEFAARSDLHIYSGGLGVLAGDVIREASDRGLPMVAIGLYYNKGYSCKMRRGETGFVEVCDDIPPESVGLEPVTNAAGSRIIVTVLLQDREVKVQAWKILVGSVPLYLLDANVPENTTSDRTITDRLYVGDKEIRLKQEIILGIGGQRLLEELNIHPTLYHLNEGHSAFLVLELIRHQMAERKLDFAEAEQFARRRVVFTNHTLVAAGNETYDADLVSLMLSRYCQQLGVPVQDVINLGLVHQSTTFSMTMLSLRMAGIINGVSKLHAVKAREIWTAHPMVGITNGVHVPTWDTMGGAELSAPGSLWNAHQARKTELIEKLALAGRSWNKDDLLIGWARRIVGYKRPLAILEDTERFLAIAGNKHRNVRLVIAGQPHPNDADGVAMLNQIHEITEGPLKKHVLYLPNYDMKLAASLVAGCDLWLNTPVIGFEASGTSGMKAAMNGTLPWSTKDGWVDEVELYGVGWAIDSEQIKTNLLDVLEHDILPMYNDRGEDGVPVDWERHMRNARAMVMNEFTATHMLRQYVQFLYN